MITLSVFGALLLYVLAMASLFRLRQKEPGLTRPFRAPLYPYLPALALLFALVCLFAVAYSSWLLALVFSGLLLAGMALGGTLRIR